MVSTKELDYRESVAIPTARHSTAVADALVPCWQSRWLYFLWTPLANSADGRIERTDYGHRSSLNYRST